MHRRAITCELCFQQFFPASMKFHMKSCQEKQRYVEIPCQFCEQAFQKQDLQNHMIKCKKRVKVDKYNTVDKEQTSELKQTIQEPIKDNNMKCKFCQRGFAADRLIVHQRICKNVKKNRKVFDSTKQRLENIVPSTQIKKITQFSQIQQKQYQLKSNWKVQSEQFRQQLKESRKHQEQLNVKQSNRLQTVDNKFMLIQNKVGSIQNNQKNFSNNLNINMVKQTNSMMNYGTKLKSNRENLKQNVNRKIGQTRFDSYDYTKLSSNRDSYNQQSLKITHSNQTSASNPLCTNKYFSVQR